MHGDLVWSAERTMQQGTYLDRSNYIVWNGRNSNGTPVGSGAYIIRADVGGKVFTKQTVFLRKN
jgi:hypothetical protein